MKIIQLSDIHLLSSSESLIKGRNPLIHLKCALNESIKYNPDLILITGDICEDESRSGYKHLKEELKLISNSTTIALLPGNHDNPTIMNDVLAPYATIAPAEIICKGVRLIILSSHIDGRIEGIIEQSQIFSPVKFQNLFQVIGKDNKKNLIIFIICRPKIMRSSRML